MCGIIGYSGPLEAGKLLLNGLAQYCSMVSPSLSTAVTTARESLYLTRTQKSTLSKKSEKLLPCAKYARKIPSFPIAESATPAGRPTAA